MGGLRLRVRSTRRAAGAVRALEARTYTRRLSEQRGESALAELPKQRRESALTLAQGVL